MFSFYQSKFVSSKAGISSKKNAPTWIGAFFSLNSRISYGKVHEVKVQNPILGFTALVSS